MGHFCTVLCMIFEVNYLYNTANGKTNYLNEKENLPPSNVKNENRLVVALVKYKESFESFNILLFFKAIF